MRHIRQLFAVANCIGTCNHSSPVCSMTDHNIMTSSTDSQKSQTSLRNAEGVENNKQEPTTVNSVPATPAPSFAEGGTRAWLVVLGCWCVAFASFGIVNTFGYASSSVYDMHAISDLLQRLRDLLFADLSSRLFSLYCCLDRLYPSLGPALSHSDLGPR